MSIAPDLLRQIVEAALMAAGKPLSINQLQQLFEEEEKPAKAEFEAAFEDIQTDCAERGFELLEVSSGWRFQVRQDMAKWVGRLWEEKPQKYSRAMLETLALVAYRQPITRGDIEQIRGVAVSSHIMKSLLERDWVKVVGHRDVPGRPAMYATTREFLDYFNLKSLEELPTLAEIKDLDSLNQELDLEMEEPPASLELKDEEISTVSGDAEHDADNAMSAEGNEDHENTGQNESDNEHDAESSEASEFENPGDSGSTDSEVPEAVDSVETEQERSDIE